MNPKVSIIIACYNDPDVVHAIHHANNQTYINKEIIIINDGSNKEVSELISSLSNQVNIILNQNNRGQSAARNNGIEKASGDFILNWDSDDYFVPDFLEKAIRIFEEDEMVKIVTCKAQRFNKKGNIDIFTPSGGKIDDFLFRNCALGSAMFRKKDWEVCGGYEEKLPLLGFEDWEFYLNILKTGGIAYVLPEVLFNYQVRENSTTAKIKDFKSDKFKHIILKHPELYKENFEALVTNLIERLKIEEREKIKNTKRLDFRLGNTILRPLRFIKSFLSKRNVSK